MTDDIDPDLDIYVQAVLGKKARGIIMLEVRELTSIADVFLICSGQSHRQVTAIAESVQKELKTRGIRPMSVEGTREGHWVLMDYGHVIIHIFYEPVRQFYDLEGLWADARRIRTKSMTFEENNRHLPAFDSDNASDIS